MGRGNLTEQVQEHAKQHLHRYITTTELRLLPYLHFCCVNDKPLEHSRVNDEELAIVQTWEKQGRLECSANSPVKMTMDFFRFCCNVMWESYANKLEDEDQW